MPASPSAEPQFDLRIPVPSGISLAADVGGPVDGPTVVLLHGGGQTRHSWSGTWKILIDAGWRAWSLDLRGHGDSDWAPDGAYGIDDFAGDVAAVARDLPHPPVLVGASLGGLSSLVAVADAPVQSEVARGLVLVDVAHRLEVEGRERIGAFMTAHLDGFTSLDEAADVIAAYNPHRPRPTDLTGLAKNLRERNGRWHWHWDPAFVLGKFGSADETRSSVVQPGRLEAAVEALTIPTLLVRGRSSDLLSEEGAADFLARAPHAEFADVAGAGHMVAGDRNEVFNRAVLDFLDRHRHDA
jgi:pimeloyl-ACP methyl ester carboxylesterase